MAESPTDRPEVTLWPSLVQPTLSEPHMYLSLELHTLVTTHTNTMPGPAAQTKVDGAPVVYGLSLTRLTQCAHWHSPLDIIAVKHFCCKKFYACISCHDALETHASDVWPCTRRDEGAVLCGQCRHVLTVNEYLESGSRCTECGSAFNPGCKKHWGLYFEVGDKSSES